MIKFNTLVLSSLAAISLIIGQAHAETMTNNTATTQQNLLYVNINTDSQETLADLLIGIGEKKAQAIIEYRETHGHFNSADELLNVKGIGEKTLERNRAAIVLKLSDDEMELSAK